MINLLYPLVSLSLPRNTADLSNPICVWGDSTTNGTGAGGGELTIRSKLSQLFANDRYVINLGIGGEPPAEIRDRFIAEVDRYPEFVHILNFGRADYGGLSSDYTDDADACFNARINDMIGFMVPGVGANTNEQIPMSAQITISNDARSELISSYPNNHIDQLQVMWDDVTGADDQVDQDAESVGYCPPKYLADSIHRNAAGQALEAQAIYNFIITNNF